VDNQGEHDHSTPPSDRAHENWIVWCVSRIKVKFQERCARHKSESAPDRAARRTANATWCIALFTAVAVCVGYYQWRALRSTDERIGQQIEVMKSDQRAWVSIDGDHHSGIAWEERGARISVYFNLKNVAKTPATDIFFEAKHWLPKIGEPATPVNAIKAYIDDIELRRSRSIVAGEAYFPNHTYRQGIDILIDRTEFEATSNAIHGPVTPRVIACISYRTLSLEAFRHTCTSYYVTILKDVAPGQMFGLAVNENVPADHVALGTAFYSYAD
jgi:hypothetical protein